MLISSNSCPFFPNHHLWRLIQMDTTILKYIMWLFLKNSCLANYSKTSRNISAQSSTTFYSILVSGDTDTRPSFWRLLLGGAIPWLKGDEGCIMIQLLQTYVTMSSSFKEKNCSMEHILEHTHF